MRRLYSVEPYASVEQVINYKDMCSIDQPIYKYPLKARDTCRGRADERERQRVKSGCDRANSWRRYYNSLLPAERDPHDVLDSFCSGPPEFPPSFPPFALTTHDGLPHPLYQHGAVRMIGRGLRVQSLFRMRIRFERQARCKQVALLTEEWLASLATA